MQRSRVLNLRSFRGVIEFVLNNKMLIILTLFLLIGIFSGVFTYGDSSELNGFAESNFSRILTERQHETFTKVMFDSFFESMLYIVACFIFGASMLGLVMLPLCLSLKGFLYGQTAALLYSVYSLKGIAFHTVLVLPVAVIFAVLLIFAGRESMRFSFLLTRAALPDTPPMNLSFDFKSYCLRYLGFCFGAFFCAVVDALLSSNLLNSFSL